MFILSKKLSFFLLFSFLLSSSLSITDTERSSSLPAIGVTYSNQQPINIVHHHNVVYLLKSLKITCVRLPESDPDSIRMFSYSGVPVIINVPNSLIPDIASNKSSAVRWINRRVVPFYPRVQISIISIGNDVPHTSPDLSDFLLPAIENVHEALDELGLGKISVSTSFSFAHVVSNAFPPSAAEFQESVAETVMNPLLDFLVETNSSFLINLYPYNLYRSQPEIPIGFALFQERQHFNFHDDPKTGLRYRNLFDMMVDAVITAMAAAGREGIPVVVTETGWPSHVSDAKEADEASHLYAEMYLKGLVRHLRSGVGTPLRRNGVVAAYIFELFDQKGPEMKWGILNRNMTPKYHVDFSGSAQVIARLYQLIIKLILATVVAMLGIHFLNSGRFSPEGN